MLDVPILVPVRYVISQTQEGKVIKSHNINFTLLPLTRAIELSRDSSLAGDSKKNRLLGRRKR